MAGYRGDKQAGSEKQPLGPLVKEEHLDRLIRSVPQSDKTVSKARERGKQGQIRRVHSGGRKLLRSQQKGLRVSIWEDRERPGKIPTLKGQSALTIPGNREVSFL